ncbi:MAG: hypothetical protein OQK78_01390 [Gammaproteobacteria bacterium]|nr:hypothetical protein [Gammaproteobacteria bacterium]
MLFALQGKIEHLTIYRLRHTFEKRMGTTEKRGTVKERTIIVLLLVLLPLLPPLIDLWSSSVSYWYSPYLIWGGMIVAAYLLQLNLTKGTRD